MTGFENLTLKLTLRVSGSSRVSGKTPICRHDCASDFTRMNFLFLFPTAAGRDVFSKAPSPRAGKGTMGSNVRLT